MDADFSVSVVSKKLSLRPVFAATLDTVMENCGNAEEMLQPIKELISTMYHAFFCEIGLLFMSNCPPVYKIAGPGSSAQLVVLSIKCSKSRATGVFASGTASLLSAKVLATVSIVMQKHGCK